MVITLDVPHIVTELPGPKSRELLELKEKYTPKAAYLMKPVIVKRAKGAVVEDVDENVFIDFTSGIAVLNAGHTPDDVVQAIKEQAENLIHTCAHVTGYESYIKLAEKLSNIAPGEEHKKAFFVNSGAEAVENAVKIARYYTKRIGIITWEKAFHGRSYLTMALTSKIRPYKFGFFAYMPGVIRYPFPDPYRCPFKTNTPEECAYAALEYVEKGFKTYTDPEETAAILIEPVLGEGGYIIPPKEFMKGLREFADKYNLVFIADEIQSGMGRTGKMFAVEHFNIVPDLITFAKSVAAGMPLSGVIGKESIMDTIHIAGIGSTFGGNPLSCAAGLKAVEIIEKNLKHAQEVGDILDKRLNELYDKYEEIGDVRGLGPMTAVEFVKNRETKEPDEDLTKKIVNNAFKKGLLLITCGVYNNVIRVIPPIIIENELLEKGLDILDEAIKASI